MLAFVRPLRARCAAQRLDPLAFLRYLAKLGDASRIRLLSEAIPALDSLDAEACYIGFELRLLSDSTSREELASVFEFALDDCDLRILPPGSAPADFEDLAQHRCGDAAEARTALFACWEALGLRFPLRIEPAAAPDAADDDALPSYPTSSGATPTRPAAAMTAAVAKATGATAAATAARATRPASCACGPTSSTT